MHLWTVDGNIDHSSILGLRLWSFRTRRRYKASLDPAAGLPSSSPMADTYDCTVTLCSTWACTWPGLHSCFQLGWCCRARRVLDLHANGNTQGALLERRQTRASLGRENGPPVALSGNVRKAEDQTIYSPMDIAQVPLHFPSIKYNKILLHMPPFELNLLGVAVNCTVRAFSFESWGMCSLFLQYSSHSSWYTGTGLKVLPSSFLQCG